LELVERRGLKRFQARTLYVVRALPDPIYAARPGCT
jgi:hypothetical protein